MAGELGGVQQLGDRRTERNHHDKEGRSSETARYTTKVVFATETQLPRLRRYANPGYSGLSRGFVKSWMDKNLSMDRGVTTNVKPGKKWLA
jgi:hypothetical protein